MERETVARELAGVLKAIDDLKHGRPGCQSAREQCASPAEASIKALLHITGFALDADGNLVDMLPEIIAAQAQQVAEQVQTPAPPPPAAPPAVEPPPEPPAEPPATV